MNGIPHLAFPLRFHRGVAVTVEQDSPQHLADQVAVAASTEQGWRVEAPDFGIPSYLMAADGVDIAELRAALAESVPDAAQAVERIESPDDVRAERIRVLIEEEN